jgi:hypothetical protein
MARSMGTAVGRTSAPAHSALCLRIQKPPVPPREIQIIEAAFIEARGLATNAGVDHRYTELPLMLHVRLEPSRASSR